MERDHYYTARLRWTGNLGSGTSDYESYSRDHEIKLTDDIVIPGSSDPAFRGDPKRANPEQFLVGAVASCHMLWFLHLCSVKGIIVLSYDDQPDGIMRETASGAGQFEAIALKPRVTLQDLADEERAAKLHHQAHDYCFIANSVNFKITVTPEFTGPEL